MRIPFPKYYEIASEEFQGLEGHIYSRSAKTYIDNKTTIEHSKGNPLSSFSKYNDDPIGRRLIVEFKLNENQKYCSEIYRSISINSKSNNFHSFQFAMVGFYFFF